MILYDGIGASKDIHTEEEFLNIMKKVFTQRDWKAEFEQRLPRENHYQLDFKDWVLPDDFIFFTLEDWIEYSGAVRILK